MTIDESRQGVGESLCRPVFVALASRVDLSSATKSTAKNVRRSRGGVGVNDLSHRAHRWTGQLVSIGAGPKQLTPNLTKSAGPLSTQYSCSAPGHPNVGYPSGAAKSRLSNSWQPLFAISGANAGRWGSRSGGPASQRRAIGCPEEGRASALAATCRGLSLPDRPGRSNWEYSDEPQCSSASHRQWGGPRRPACPPP